MPATAPNELEQLRLLIQHVQIDCWNGFCYLHMPRCKETSQAMVQTGTGQTDVQAVCKARRCSHGFDLSCCQSCTETVAHCAHHMVTVQTSEGRNQHTHTHLHVMASMTQQQFESMELASFLQGTEYRVTYCMQLLRSSSNLYTVLCCNAESD